MHTHTHTHVCIFLWLELWLDGEGSAAAAKLFQSCPTLCNPIDSSSPGSPLPGILQARTLEWIAISFSNAWKWKVKVKSLGRVRLSDYSWPHGLQPTRLLHPWDFPGKSTGVECHHLFWGSATLRQNFIAFKPKDHLSPLINSIPAIADLVAAEADVFCL